MRIVHCAPFSPNRCGLYEAARDMVVADKLAGHETYMLDVGTTSKDTYTPGAPDKIDDRGGTKIVTWNPDIIWSADVIIAHTGIPDNWIAPCSAPVIWMLHGRPRACFSPEYGAGGHTYSLIANLARWPRIKKMVTFWPYHVQFWNPVIPPEKLVFLPAPPIDEKRFCKDGPKHSYTAMGGKWNIIICESWREDVDTYEITHGAIALAKRMQGIKFHLYAMETPLKCWEYLTAELRRLGALGEVWARRANMEEVYRAADILLTPQRIATRSVGEALSCGLPVVAARGCEYATYTAHPDEPQEVAQALEMAISEKDAPDTHRKIHEAAQAFALSRYSEAMRTVYAEVRNGGRL